MIKAMIIDSDIDDCHSLRLLLDQYCPHVKVLDCITSGADAMAVLSAHKPDLVFIDVELSQLNGFELLDHVQDNVFEVIFTSHHDQLAIKAIRFNPLAYLIKPIDPKELKDSVAKLMHKPQKALTQQLELLMEKFSQRVIPVHKVALPTQHGLQMIDVNLIISCTSDSNYSIINLKGNQKITVSRTLKEMEEMLVDYSFLRVHHSHLANLNEVEKYVKGEGGWLVMSDGSRIDVSRSRKDALLQKLLH